MLAIAGVALFLQPDPAMIGRLFEERLATCEKQFGLEDVRTAAAARDLGLYLRGQGERAPAAGPLSEALRIDEKALGSSDRQTLTDAANLAGVLPPDRAERLWQRASESSDAATSSGAFAALAEIRETAGDRDGAAALYRKALATEEAARGKNSTQVAVRLNALALVSEPDSAIPLLERALSIDRLAWGEKHPETATTETNLSGELLAAGRISESVEVGTSAVINFEATLGSEHPRTAAALSNLADALRAKGDTSGAEKLYRRALQIDQKVYGADNSETLNDVKNLADFLREMGRSGEAAELEQRFGRKAAPK